LLWKLQKQTASKDHESDSLNLSSACNALGDNSGKDPGCHDHWSGGPGALAFETPLDKKTN